MDEVARNLVAVTGDPATAPRQAFTGDYRYALRVTGGEKWNQGLSSSGLGSAIHHTLARRNARVAMQDSVQARACVTRSADSISDGGLRLELAPVIGILGITKEKAAEWSRDVEERFDLWAKSMQAHRAGFMNFYRAQGFWAFCRQRDNDQFVRLDYDDDPTLQNPLQFEFLDPDQIRGDAFTNLYGFNQTTTTNGFQLLADGIQRDERGRETGYKVWIRNGDGTYLEKMVPATYPGGRRAMIHGFEIEYAGQGRGYTRIAHAIQEFENITDFSAATIKKAINQSCIVGFVEPSKDEDAQNPFEGILTNQGAGPAQQLFSTNPALNPGVANPAVGPQPDIISGIETCYQVPEATFDTPGSMFVANLTKGSKITFPANSAPGDSFGDFVGDIADYIGASLNIPKEVVLMKFGQNYSASRATLLLFWDYVQQERAYMAAQFLNIVVEEWMNCEIAAGRIVAQGWSDPRMKADWMNCSWIGGGAPDIDPAKSAKARRDNIEVGVTNAERESHDFNGTSAADNIAKNNATYSAYKPLPWNEAGNPPPGTPVAAPPADKKAKMTFPTEFWEEMRMIVEEVVHGG